MTKYPLIEKLELKIVDRRLPLESNNWFYVVSADQLEAILAKAQTVSSWGLLREWSVASPGDWKEISHTALLIGIQPIEKVTAEGLLNEALNEIPLSSPISIKIRQFLEEK